MLEGLLGRDVSARESTAPATMASMAYFRREDGSLAAMLGMDLELSCSAAAALTMIPGQTAREAVASGEIPANLAENLHEVVNVAAVLFTVGDPQRLTLKELEMLPDLEDALALAKTAVGTSGVVVDIDGYPSGRLVLWVF